MYYNPNELIDYINYILNQYNIILLLFLLIIK